MPTNLPFLTLHQSQIDAVAASIDTGNDLAVRVTASAERRNEAIKALAACGIAVPQGGAFTLRQLDAALDTAFHSADPNRIRRRMELKFIVASGGLLLEKSNVDKRAITTAALMLAKAKIPLPTVAPYSVQALDSLLAETDISIEHRLQIKQACFAAGLAEGGVIEPKTPVQPIQAARSICDMLGLQFPANGMKLSTGVVDSKMAEKGWDERRRLNSKITLQAANAL
jgi:hypothetical protein